jgi:hypothetical protein
MNKQGWLTRTTDSVGGDGQNARSLNQGRYSAQPEVA